MVVFISLTYNQASLEITAVVSGLNKYLGSESKLTLFIKVFTLTLNSSKLHGNVNKVLADWFASRIREVFMGFQRSV